MLSARANLAQALVLRLLTRQGALAALGHPDYGSRLTELIGELNNDTTRNLARLFIGGDEGRGQTTLQERFAAKAHQHLGELTTAWLDAELQSRTGQDGSLSARTVLADIDRKIASLGSEVAHLTVLLDAQQKLIDRSAVDELDRSRTLKQFEDRFAGVENLRTLVSTLSADVGSVKGNVTTLLELRKSLSDAAGNPIDVAKMRQDLTDVQGLRENLKGVDGNLLRVRDVEVQLRELSDAVGVGAAGGLDARIGSVVAAVEGRLDGKANERATALQAALKGAVWASFVSN